jgi:hypothetical protein
MAKKYKPGDPGYNPYKRVTKDEKKKPWWSGILEALTSSKMDKAAKKGGYGKYKK